jgi:LAO/AO transport system kinase
VLVETVGVGQSESEISSVADTVVMCVQPGSGDTLQFMKAGIMEVPDIAVVTKADSGAAARRAVSELEGALSLASGEAVPCMLVSAVSGEGLDALNDTINRRKDVLNGGGLEKRRQMQGEDWLASAIRQRFGQAGVDAAGDALTLGKDTPPFQRHRMISARFSLSFDKQK